MISFYGRPRVLHICLLRDWRRGEDGVKFYSAWHPLPSSTALGTQQAFSECLLNECLTAMKEQRTPTGEDGFLEPLLIHGISVPSPTMCQAAPSVLTAAVKATGLLPLAVSVRGRQQRFPPPHPPGLPSNYPPASPPGEAFIESLPRFPPNYPGWGLAGDFFFKLLR